MAIPDDATISEWAAVARADALNRVRHRLKARIAETGISMTKLARRAQLSPRTIQRFLSEPERDVQVGTVAVIASVLLVDIRDLFDPLAEAEDSDS